MPDTVPTTLGDFACASRALIDPAHGQRVEVNPELLRRVRRARGLSTADLAQRIADRLHGGRYSHRVSVRLRKLESGHTRTLPRDVYEVLLSELAAAGWADAEPEDVDRV
jgi:hypothetical protein